MVEAFCASPFPNEKFTKERQEFVAAHFNGEHEGKHARAAKTLSAALELPSYVPLMMWTGAPYQIQNQIIREKNFDTLSYAPAVMNFKKQAFEKLEQEMPKESWEKLKGFSRMFWEVKFSEFPIPEVKLPQKFKEYSNQVQGARRWLHRELGKDENHFYTRSFTSVTNEPAIGAQVEKIYTAFVRHYATSPRDGVKLFAEYQRFAKSEELEKQDYFKELEDRFFIEQWGPKLIQKQDVQQAFDEPIFTCIECCTRLSVWQGRLDWQQRLTCSRKNTLHSKQTICLKKNFLSKLNK